MAAPLIVIVGETASGKSALALRLAGLLNGQIICADSRTVYKGMDIGTAKPTMEDQCSVRHYGLDVVSPGMAFNASMFKDLAIKAIDEIRANGHVPIMVGGTGLYIDAVLYDYGFLPPANTAERANLEAMSISQLHNELSVRNITPPMNVHNKRHLVRAIETNGEQATRKPMRSDAELIGLTIDRSELENRIRRRTQQMIANGLVDEVKQLVDMYGYDSESLKTTSYKPFIAYLKGSLSLPEATEQFVRNDLALAKRQRTWFKRNKSIHWADNPDKAVSIITTLLDKPS